MCVKVWSNHYVLVQEFDGSPAGEQKSAVSDEVQGEVDVYVSGLPMRVNNHKWML